MNQHIKLLNKGIVFVFFWGGVGEHHVRMFSPLQWFYYLKLTFVIKFARHIFYSEDWDQHKLPNVTTVLQALVPRLAMVIVNVTVGSSSLPNEFFPSSTVVKVNV